MATTVIGYSNGIAALANGQNPLAGTGESYQFNLSMPTTTGTDTILLTDAKTGFQTQIGAGNVTGVNFTYVTAFNNKVYGLAGPTVYCSGINQPMVWNNPNATGNGFVTLNNWYATPVTLSAVVPYQGRLVFFSRRTAQIFVIDANLQNWQQQQIFTNIGTVAPLSVQSLGDLDVLFLSDTGIRSLRVRDLTLNAYVSDLGSPIDSLVQTALLANNYSSASGVVEPTANRYWCHLNGVIYVFSYFPSVKIAAWGTYLPTYPNNLVLAYMKYSAGGTFTLPSVIGQTYYWAKGANDVSITDGTTTLTASGSFTAAGTVLTLTGTHSVAITAVVEEQTPFTPQKFCVYNGQVYVRDANAFYLFGGTSNNQYDGCVLSGTTSWLDAKKPAVRKEAKGLDTAFQGAFSFQLGMDQLTETMRQVAQVTTSTFQHGSYSCSMDGFHVRFGFNTTDNQYARLSSLIFRYNECDEK